ncbi:MAG: OmpP1/FadL family transporter [Nitrospirota bacterium]
MTTLSGGWTPAYASGFAITAQGAGGMARSSAFTAQADDPSALYYNPAGISQLASTTALIGVTVLRPHAEYDPSATGNATTERERYYVLPQLYVTTPLGNNFSVGLGVFTPFGLSTKWPGDWDGRFQVIDATIKATTVNPVIAWRATQGLTAAVGVQYFQVKLSEHRALNMAVGLPGAGEGAVTLSGDARSFGYNAAVLVVPSDRWQLGLSYRSRVNVEINDGWADFTVPALFATSFPDSEIRTALTLPPSLRAGLMMRPAPDWTIEVDAAWTGWSTIDRMEVQFTGGLSPETTTFGWRDVMAYSIGTEYRFSSIMRLRGGYLYDLSPIPDQYATPLIPDADRQGVSVGVGVTAARWTLDVGYQFLWFERVKENSVGSSSNSTVPPIDARANGSYRSTAHVLGVSAGHTF